MELWREEFWEESQEIYSLKDVSTKPVILKNIPVIYPNDAIEKKLSGKVVIEAVIDERGFVLEADIYKCLYDTIEISLDSKGNNEVHVIKSNKTTSLDMAAMEAAKKTRFNPALVKGKPVKSIAQIPFTFVAK